MEGKMEMWRYIVIKTNAVPGVEDIQNQLNELGKDGWDLFSVTILEQAQTEDHATGSKVFINHGTVQYVLKKPLVENRESNIR
jgi:hypothetical protein